MSRSSLLLLTLLAGCNNTHLVATTESPGYLSGDSCTKHAGQSACVADTAGNCGWLDAPSCPAGVPCPPGVCYQQDPCLTIDDEASCKAKTGCEWSQAGALCPVGATCPNKGYCHVQGPSGCGCVTPLGCPPGAPCPPPECDCSGGSGGGGTCTCSAPACAPGQTCPPAVCTCDPGAGCVDDGTCTCACPDCAPGQTCPPCGCSCGSGGAVPAPTDPSKPTGTVGMGGGTAPDPCSVHADKTACSADTTNKCVWYAIGAPCAPGDPMCKSGVCQSEPAGGGGGCGCACPGCALGQTCPPCTCDCPPPPSGGGGCVPPPLPGPPPTGGGGTACPAIGCEIHCPNGNVLDANGCPTCQCK